MAKKKSVEEKVSEAREKAVKQIIELMETKGLYWTREWGNYFGCDGSLPRNGITNRWYAGCNVMHLIASAMSQGFTDPRWYTFNQAKSIGYLPRKGEHATLVEYHKLMKGMKDADGKWTKDEDEAVEKFSYWKLVGVFHVFNAEQLADENGEPMQKEEYEQFEGEELDGYLCDVADCLIETSRCKVREKKGSIEAYYEPGIDRITIPHRTQFNNMESFVGTLTHEMTHSTCVPLNREVSGHFGSDKYAFEELVAELGSVFCCMELGICRPAELENDKNFVNHAAYLDSWLGHFKKNKDYLFKAAGLAARAATYLMGRYYGNEETDETEKIKEQAA
jgi:antirestriction protein ArdC